VLARNRGGVVRTLHDWWRVPRAPSAYRPWFGLDLCVSESALFPPSYQHHRLSIGEGLGRSAQTNDSGRVVANRSCLACCGSSASRLPANRAVPATRAVLVIVT
jgi:hypothetical protein